MSRPVHVNTRTDPPTITYSDGRTRAVSREEANRHMSVFANPEEHAANPPETWKVVKVSERLWALRTAEGTTLETFPTMHRAEEERHTGRAADLYRKETRWYAGEIISGWRPYADLVR